MSTYGDFFKEPTREEFAKRCSIVNVMRERERCAKIAEEWYKRLDEVGDAKYQAIRKKAGVAIAAAIRAQPEDFRTLGEIMAEESKSVL